MAAIVPIKNFVPANGDGDGGFDPSDNGEEKSFTFFVNFSLLYGAARSLLAGVPSATPGRLALYTILINNIMKIIVLSGEIFSRRTRRTSQPKENNREPNQPENSLPIERVPVTINQTFTQSESVAALPSFWKGTRFSAMWYTAVWKFFRRFVGDFIS